mmetsp:Transcript_19993/g.25234  ORF Transcript_19993/g.25234 Transcript_19993/m.25234 type:complete len:81 (+) Transcript_19993:522-764(+)
MILELVKASVILGLTKVVVIHVSTTYVIIIMITKKLTADTIPAFFKPRMAEKKKMDMYTIPNTERFKRYISFPPPSYGCA